MKGVSLVGLRVLRGPDWTGGDADGGEGHLGTVRDVLGDNCVRVLWDMGQESTCKAGGNGGKELRIFDTAGVGVRHVGVQCSSCGENDVFGTLWRCTACTGCHLCSECYSLDKHDPGHCFHRIDFQNVPGIPVSKRKTSVRTGAMGLLPGARVQRGWDWEWGDQDGGSDSVGTLEKYEDVEELFKRALMRVRWTNGRSNVYRVGYKGKVDLICVEEERGTFYYRDHLACLGDGNFAGWSEEGTIYCPDAHSKDQVVQPQQTSNVASDTEDGGGESSSLCDQVLEADRQALDDQVLGADRQALDDQVLEADHQALDDQVLEADRQALDDQVLGADRQALDDQVLGADHQALDDQVLGADRQAPAHQVEGDTPPGPSPLHEDNEDSSNSGDEEGADHCPSGTASCDASGTVVRARYESSPQSAEGMDASGAGGQQEGSCGDGEGRPLGSRDSLQGETVVQATLLQGTGGARPKTGERRTCSHHSSTQKGGEPSAPHHSSGPLPTGGAATSHVDVRSCEGERREVIEEEPSARKGDHLQETHSASQSEEIAEGPAGMEGFSGSESCKGPSLGAYARPSEDANTLLVGNKAAIRVNEDCLRVLQKDFGGTTKGMVESIGLTGVVTSIRSDGAVHVRFVSLAYRFNPDAVIKVCNLRVGQQVRVSTDVDLIKVLNTKVGWNSEMRQVLGKVGKITKIDRDGDVKVDFGDRKYSFSPACCTPEPGCHFDTTKEDETQPQATSDGEDSDDDSSDRSRWLRKLMGGGGGLKDLRDLARLGGLGTLRSLMSAASDDDDTDIGRLHSAISKLDTDKVRALCHRDPTLVHTLHKGLTPLMLACHRGKLPVVRELLKLGADINGEGMKQQTALGVALEEKEEEIAMFLLEQGADPTKPNGKDRTPLHMATSSGMAEAAQVLIYMGADINAQDKYGDTPLHDAISTNREFLVDIFLQLDTVDTRVVNKNGLNPLQLAAYKGNAYSVKQLLARDRSEVDKLHRGDYSALHLATAANSPEAVRLLVQTGGANINLASGDKKVTALHMASVRRSVPIVEALLDLGADVNVQDKEGDTPLHHAMGGASSRHLTTSEQERDTAERVRASSLLITHGAIVDAENRLGKTALVYGRTEIRAGVERFIAEHPEAVRYKQAPREKDGSRAVKSVIMTSALKDFSLAGCRSCGLRVDVTLVPCGHRTACGACVQRVSRCPLCDSHVQGCVPQREREMTSASSGGQEPDKGAREFASCPPGQAAPAHLTSLPAGVSSASVSSNILALFKQRAAMPQASSPQLATSSPDPPGSSTPSAASDSPLVADSTCDKVTHGEAAADSTCDKVTHGEAADSKCDKVTHGEAADSTCDKVMHGEAAADSTCDKVTHGEAADSTCDKVTHGEAAADSTCDKVTHSEAADSTCDKGTHGVAADGWRRGGDGSADGAAGIAGVVAEKDGGGGAVGEGLRQEDEAAVSWAGDAGNQDTSSDDEGSSSLSGETSARDERDVLGLGAVARATVVPDLPAEGSTSLAVNVSTSDEKESQAAEHQPTLGRTDLSPRLSVPEGDVIPAGSETEDVQCVQCVQSVQSKSEAAQAGPARETAAVRDGASEETEASLHALLQRMTPLSAPGADAGGQARPEAEEELTVDDDQHEVGAVEVEEAGTDELSSVGDDDSFVQHVSLTLPHESLSVLAEAPSEEGGETDDTNKCDDEKLDVSEDKDVDESDELDAVSVDTARSESKEEEVASRDSQSGNCPQKPVRDNEDAACDEAAEEEWKQEESERNNVDDEETGDTPGDEGAEGCDGEPQRPQTAADCETREEFDGETSDDFCDKGHRVLGDAARDDVEGDTQDVSQSGKYGHPSDAKGGNDDDETRDVDADENCDVEKDEHRDVDEQDNHDVDEDENCDVGKEEHRDVDEQDNHDVDEDENCDVGKEEHRRQIEEENRDVDEEENRDIDEEENRDVDEEENRDVDEEENRDVEEEENRDAEEDKKRSADESKSCSTDEGVNQDVDDEENRDADEEENCDVDEEENQDVDEGENHDVGEMENRDVDEEASYENCDVSDDECSPIEPLPSSSKPETATRADVMKKRDDGVEETSDDIKEEEARGQSVRLDRSSWLGKPVNSDGGHITGLGSKEPLASVAGTSDTAHAQTGPKSQSVSQPRPESPVRFVTKEVGLMASDNLSKAARNDVGCEGDAETYSDIFSTKKGSACSVDSKTDDQVGLGTPDTAASWVSAPQVREMLQPQACADTASNSALSTSNLLFLLGRGGGAGSGGGAREKVKAVEKEEQVTEGDRVAIKVSEERLQKLQLELKERVTKDILQCVGRTGTVTGPGPRGSVSVRFQQACHRLHPAALKKVCSFSRGDAVRIVPDHDLLKIFNAKVGWRPAMAEAAGRVGTITHIDTDGNVVVTFGQRGVLFAPASCTLAPGASPDTLPEPEPVSDVRKRGSASEVKDVRERQTITNGLHSGTKRGSGVVSVLSSPSFASDRSSTLPLAIKAGDCGKVSLLCQADPTLLTREHRGLTPLAYACHKGQLKVVQTLLDLGGDVNGVSQGGRSALSVTLESKREDIALFLLDRGADHNYTSPKGRTALHMAAYNNLPEALQVLISKGADVNAKDMFGDTPLLDALTLDHRAVGEFFLGLDIVDIKHANKKDITALHAASVRGNASAVERILARDTTNVNKRIQGEISALHLAANDNFVEVIRLLAINGGADVNIAADGSRQGCTPLHLACFKGHLEAVETLLELGAQVNVLSRNQETPLHLAMGSPLQKDTEEFSDDPILRTRAQIACLLISNGAFVDVEDNMGRAPTRYGLQEVRAAVQHFIDANRQIVRRRGREVSLQCAVCVNARSDVTLLPCGHKTVCRGCSHKVSHCPVCGHRVDSTTDDDKTGALFEAISCRW